jgi:hypothetical protein
MSINFATCIGIFLQLIGAAYIVYQSFRTTNKLQKYSTPVTYGTLSPTIETLAKELAGQFSQQLVGFLFLLMGSCFQFYAVIHA